MKQGRVGVWGLAQGLIGEHKLAEGWVEGCGGWSDGVVPIAGWLGIGVAVEEWLDAGRAGPESATADFMGVGIAGDSVGESGHAGMLGGGSAGEARTGQVHGAPEEVDGADFAAETGSELGDDSRGLEQNSPEELGEFRVVGLVEMVLIEGDGVSYLAGHGPDADGDAEGIERGHKLLVKERYRHGLERDGAATGVAGFNDEFVVKEIEIDLDQKAAVRHEAGGESADGGVEGDVPAVVEGRGELETDFADDLQPELEGGAGI